MKPGSLYELTKEAGIFSKAKDVATKALSAAPLYSYKAGKPATKSEVSALAKQLKSKAHVTENFIQQKQVSGWQAGVDLGKGIRSASRNPIVRTIVGKKGSKAMREFGKDLALEGTTKMRAGDPFTTAAASKLLLRERGKIRVIPKPVRKQFMKAKRRLGGLSASAQMMTSRPVLNLPKNAPASVAAHELGHASGPFRRTRAMVPGLLMKSKHKAVRAAGYAAQLGEEAQASIRGYQAMKSTGMYSEKELNRAKKNLGSAFATYLGNALR